MGEVVEITTKVCSKCGEEKPISEFGKRSNGSKDGRISKCKKCHNEYMIQWRIDNPESYRMAMNKSEAKRPKRTKKDNPEYYEQHREETLNRSREGYQKNKDHILEKHKEWKASNKERNAEWNKQYAEDHKEERMAYLKRYIMEHKEQRREYERAYYKNKRENNVWFRLRGSLGNRISSALKGRCKSAHTMSLIGCSIDFLMKYLEEQFIEGMSWDTYGFRGWHVDHVKPCALFNLEDPEEQRKCFHYTNLQPLWWYDNIRKSDNYEE